jgi:hypothetical protein
LPNAKSVIKKLCVIASNNKILHNEIKKLAPLFLD